MLLIFAHTVVKARVAARRHCTLLLPLMLFRFPCAVSRCAAVLWWQNNGI